MYKREKTPAIVAKIVDTTSAAIVCEGAKRILIEFIEGGTVLNRSGVLTVTGAMEEGGTHHALPILIEPVAGDDTKTTARIASKTRNAAGRDLLALDMSYFSFAEIKVAVDVTDGATPTGNFSVDVFIEQ